LSAKSTSIGVAASHGLGNCEGTATPRQSLVLKDNTFAALAADAAPHTETERGLWSRPDAVPTKGIVRRIVEVQDIYAKTGKPFEPHCDTCGICLFLERVKARRKHAVNFCGESGKACYAVHECKFGGPVLAIVQELAPMEGC